jgi:hypothetical protein
MKTKKQRMNHECTHREYFAQFVTSGFSDSVARQIGAERLIAAKDEQHLNNIPLREWDAILPPFGSIAKMKEAGDFMTLGDSVCIAKEAALQFIERNK